MTSIVLSLVACLTVPAYRPPVYGPPSPNGISVASGIAGAILVSRRDSSSAGTVIRVDSPGDSVRVVEVYYETGELEERYRILVDRGGMSVRTGPAAVWYQNGERMLECTYRDGRLHGIQSTWFETGVRESECMFMEGVADGQEKWWYESGQMRKLNTYACGVLQGEYVRWYRNGKKMEEGVFRNGKLHGKVIKYFRNGPRKEELEYENGRKVHQKVYSIKDERFH